MPLVVCDTKQPMTLDAAQHRSGKGAGDENFPVASWLVAPPYRRPIMAFYEFVRIADDIADHPTLSETDKLGHLDRLEASLLGRDDHNAAGIVLRAALAERNLSPQHAQDLLKAFRQDVTKHRYADWDELIDYCRYSAMPVGRFVLDVHGESRSTWPASDNICAVLQIINHLQDCGKDYRALNRVYIPQDSLAANGAVTEALSASASSPELLVCLHQLAKRTEEYLDARPPLADEVADTRLACEVAVIGSLAHRLLALLKQRDPLADKVHLGRGALIATMTGAVTRTLVRRLVPRAASQRRPQDLRS